MSCSSLAAALRVLRLSYVSQKTYTNHKENEHVENLVFDVAAALFVLGQSCVVVYYTLRLPHETQKFFIADRCTAAARLM